MLTKMEQTNCDRGGNEISGGAPKFYKGASVTRSMTPSSCRSTSAPEGRKRRGVISRRRVFLIWKRSSASWIRSTRPVSRRISWLVSSAQGCGHGAVHERKRPRHRGAAGYDRQALPYAAPRARKSGIKGLPMQLGIEMAAEMIAKIMTSICATASIIRHRRRKRTSRPSSKRPALRSEFSQLYFSIQPSKWIA